MFSIVSVLVLIIFDIQLYNGYKAIAICRLHGYLSWPFQPGIPAAFVARFMVLRNCSPRSMGRTRPTWHQVAHLSWRVLTQNPVGPIISPVICHDYGDYRSRWQPFGYRLQQRDCCSSLLGRTMIMRRIKEMSYRSSLISRRRRTGNSTFVVTPIECARWLRL